MASRMGWSIVVPAVDDVCIRKSWRRPVKGPLRLMASLAPLLVSGPPMLFIRIPPDDERLRESLERSQGQWLGRPVTKDCQDAAVRLRPEPLGRVHRLVRVICNAIDFNEPLSDEGSSLRFDL